MSDQVGDSVNTYLGVPLYELSNKQANRALLTLVLELRHDVQHLTTQMEIRMSTLEETVVALGAAVDRIGTVIADLTSTTATAQQAATDAQAALDAANAADAIEDAAAAAQIADLTAALQAATDALNAAVASNTAATAAVASQVTELNALGPVDPAPVDPAV